MYLYTKLNPRTHEVNRMCTFSQKIEINTMPTFLINDRKFGNKMR